MLAFIEAHLFLSYFVNMKLYMAGMVPFLISKELYRSEALQKVHRELDKKDDLAYENLERGAIDCLCIGVNVKRTRRSVSEFQRAVSLQTFSPISGLQFKPHS